MSTSTAVQHVSDTALWVATYRALESERDDAVFNDHLASRLVGDRGRAIAASMPYGKLMEWVLVIRTSAIDRLIHQAIADGVDTVLNLGAGLDTRPYRLDLPASLRWIEIDFPQIIEYKNELLADETPQCQLERVVADLSNPADRQAAFDAVASSSKRVVVLTEGVIPYLSPDEAAELSAALHAEPAFEYWIQDFRQGGRATALNRLTKHLKDAPLKFMPKDWFGFFRKQGWTPREIICMHDESVRLGRRPPFVFPISLIYMAKFLISKRMRDKTVKQNGYVMLEKS